MKKLIPVTAFLLAATLLSGCSNAASKSTVSAVSSQVQSSQSQSQSQAADASAVTTAVERPSLETPEEVKAYLQQGNDSYLAGKNAPDISAERRKATAEEGQNPYAVVVNCSDSRVPAEHIFDAGVGDLFVIRTAGNVVGDYEMGSVEYAVEHLGTKLVVVMGHTQCGAVAAAIDGHAEGSIQNIVDEIQSAIGTETEPSVAVEMNAKHSVEIISASPLLAEKISSGEVKVVQATYDIETGAVEFVNVA